MQYVCAIGVKITDNIRATGQSLLFAVSRKNSVQIAFFLAIGLTKLSKVEFYPLYSIY